MISDEMIRASRNLRLQLLDDPYRPAYHFVVPEDIARPADPNGAIFWNGRYHLGYIYQDEGIHYWGHVSSLDLLHWRHHKPWLFPTVDSPEAGIYSGNCFINKAGQATMLYHGVNAGNCIATCDDNLLDNWQKLSSNPIIAADAEHGEKGPNPGTKNPYASWDPHGWLENDTYYAIFGGKQPAIFKAKVLDDWEYVGELLAHAAEDVDLNEDISCPDFFQMDDKWVLVCISHRLGCRYYVGEWRDEQFFPESHAQMSWVDNAFFAPESLLAPDGRRIMWAWARDQRPEADQRNSGWSGTFSLPRQIWLDEAKQLRMRPIVELERLRYNERHYKSIDLASDSELPLENLEGRLLDIELVIAPRGATRCGIKVCCSPQGEEETAVGFDAVAGKLIIDTRKSSINIGPSVVECGPLDRSKDELIRLRVLVDRSVIEAFANDQQGVFRHIYPSRPDSIGVKLFSEGGQAHIHSLVAWDMMPANPY